MQGAEGLGVMFLDLKLDTVATTCSKLPTLCELLFPQSKWG